MTISNASEARDLLVNRGQFVEQIGSNRKRWRLNGEEVSDKELIRIARQLDGGDEPRSKYGNRRTVVDGITFDSAAEARRYGELRLMEQAGEIIKLEVHPRFELRPAFRDCSGKRHAPMHYEADFQYLQQSRIVVEDVKGVRTDVYLIKRDLLLYTYPHILFLEIDV